MAEPKKTKEKLEKMFGVSDMDVVLKDLNKLIDEALHEYQLFVKKDLVLTAFFKGFEIGKKFRE